MDWIFGKNIDVIIIPDRRWAFLMVFVETQSSKWPVRRLTKKLPPSRRALLIIIIFSCLKTLVKSISKICLLQYEPFAIWFTDFAAWFWFWLVHLNSSGWTKSWVDGSSSAMMMRTLATIDAKPCFGIVSISVLPDPSLSNYLTALSIIPTQSLPCLIWRIVWNACRYAPNWCAVCRMTSWTDCCIRVGPFSQGYS